VVVLSSSSMSFKVAYRGRMTNQSFSEYGDLSSPADQAGSLHLIDFDPKQMLSCGSSAQMHLTKQLNLGVGDGGIIGRRISVFKDASMRVRIAEGVIGWN